MNLDLSRPNYIITEGGVVRLTAIDLGPVDSLADALAGAAASRFPNVRPGDNMAKQGNNYYASRRITSLAFNTFFIVSGEALVPVFSNVDGAVPLSLTWSVPATMELRLGLTAEPRTDADGAAAYRVTNNFLSARMLDGVRPSTRTPGFFLLPLPNVYNDSRVCMGQGFAPPHAPLLDQLDVSAAHFRAAPWNTDLLRALDQAQQLFRWSLDGATQFPAPEDWSPLCRRVSHAALELFFI